MACIYNSHPLLNASTPCNEDIEPINRFLFPKSYTKIKTNHTTQPSLLARPSTLLLERVPRLREHGRERNPGRRLGRVDVGTPPRARRPPRRADPDTARLLHRAQRALERLDAGSCQTAFVSKVPRGDGSAKNSRFEPTPISPRKPRSLLSWSHFVAAARRSAPMVGETQTSDVPEPSLSRYWCISIAKLLDGS
jgi:hypothetical protein